MIKIFFFITKRTATISLPALKPSFDLTQNLKFNQTDFDDFLQFLILFFLIKLYVCMYNTYSFSPEICNLLKE